MSSESLASSLDLEILFEMLSCLQGNKPQLTLTVHVSVRFDVLCVFLSVIGGCFSRTRNPYLPATGHLSLEPKSRALRSRAT